MSENPRHPSPGAYSVSGWGISACFPALGAPGEEQSEPCRMHGFPEVSSWGQGAFPSLWPSSPPAPQNLKGSLEKRPPSQLSFCPSLPIRSRRCSECRARPEGHRVSPQSPGGEAAPGHLLQAQGCPPAGMGNRRWDDSPCRASLHRHPPQPAPGSAGSGARPPQGLQAPGTTRYPCPGCPSRGSAHRLLGRLFQGPSTGNERLNGPASERRNSA